MTVSEFIRRIQQKVQMLSSADIPIKFNGKDIECVIELIENGKGYYINIKQSQKDLTLTWEDVDMILDVTDQIANDDSMEKKLGAMSQKEYCQEVLKRFNEQRKK